MSILVLALCLVCVFSLTACGYNRIMYEHLSNIENYRTYEAEIMQICIYNDETHRLDEYNIDIHGEDCLSGTVYFGISIEDFVGPERAPKDEEAAKTLVYLEVTPENSQFLLSSGFYNDFIIGDTVEIQASDWTYMDGDFYYVIGVKYNGTQYLNSEDGLKNIVNMMDNDRSLF